MTLCAKQNTEAIFFRIFIERAIKGDDVYLAIIKPLILEAADCANKRKTIWELDRVGLEQKLYMLKWPMIKKVASENLFLPELLEFIDSDQETYYG